MRRRGDVERDQLLLRVDAEVDARGELEVELLDVGLGDVDVGLRRLGEPLEQLVARAPTPRRRRLFLVVERSSTRRS